jgi:hypothetical protein
MSWSSGTHRLGRVSIAAALRGALFAGAALLSVGLAGCSGLTPVYGDHGLVAEQHPFAYAKPTNRLEQIIYQDLTLKLGRTDDAQAPKVTVAATSDTRDLTRSDVSRPSDQHEAIVSADITVSDATGKVIYKAKRSASALYSIDGQGLADTEAARQAAERAAGELAETIRLTLLGALANPAG